MGGTEEVIVYLLGDEVCLGILAAVYEMVVGVIYGERIRGYLGAFVVFLSREMSMSI